MYDLVIVGGGPAGASAAIYAARKRLKTILILEEWGGQSNVSTDIQNWIGTKNISGSDLAKALREHVEANVGESLLVVTGRATTLQTSESSVTVGVRPLKKGEPESITAKTLLIATGSTRRKLEVPGAAEFDQKGLTYCATCDGPLFDGKDVVVVGGGNAAFETALQLVAYCKKVTLVNRSDVFRADEVTVAAALKKGNLSLIKNALPKKVLGDKFVTGYVYEDVDSGKEITLTVEGVFVEIGLLPNTDWVGTGVALNSIKQVVVDPKTQRTSHPRVWAAGDVTDGLYHQNNIAAGDAVKALEDIYMYIRQTD